MRAIIKVVMVEVDCPRCGEGIGAPDNESFLWPVEILKSPIKCPHCQQNLTLPAKYAKAV